MTKLRNFSTWKKSLIFIDYLKQFFCHTRFLEDLETVSIYYDEVKKSKEDKDAYPIKMPDGLR